MTVRLCAVCCAAWLMALLWSGPAQASPELLGLIDQEQRDPVLSRLAAELAARPEDYGAVRAVAERAAWLARWQVALAAWERAEALSAGNLESRIGQVGALVGLGRDAEARALSGAIVRDAPDSAAAWLYRGWALRQSPGPFGAGPARAALAYRRAAQLEPGSAEARCGLGWARWATGDRLGARRAFAAAGACETAGLEAARPGWSVSVGAYLAPSTFQDHPQKQGAFAFMALAGVELGELFYAELRFRQHQVGAQAAPGATVGATTPQSELWGRIGLHHGGFGGELLLSHTEVGGEDYADSPPIRVVAGRAWASFGLTIGGDFAYLEDLDGVGLQGGPWLSIPLLPQRLALRGGLLLSRLEPTGAPEPGMPAEDGSLAASGWAELQLAFPRWSLAIGGHGGEQIRPVRFDEASLWNVNERLVASVHLKGDVELLRTTRSASLRLFAGYELIRLQPPGLPDAPASHQHQFTFGLTSRFSGRMR